MILLKSSHEHLKQSENKQPSPPKEQVKVIEKKQAVRVSKNKNVVEKKENFVFLDPLIPLFQETLQQIPQDLSEMISEVRRQIQVSVYTSIVENKKDYLEKLFNGQAKSQMIMNRNDGIKNLSETIVFNICSDIMGNQYEVKTKNQMRMEALQYKGKSSQVIRITEDLLKRKLTDLRSDIRDENNNSLDITNFNSPKLYRMNSLGTKRAEKFVKQKQKQKQQHQKRKQKREKQKQERQERKQQEIYEMEMDQRQQRHEMLEKKYQQKRKEREQENKQSKLRKHEFKEYLDEFISPKPLYKKRQEQYFRNSIIPQNNRKMDALRQINSQHLPITLEEIKQHQEQYLVIKEDYEYERNAGRMMEIKRRKKMPKYFKNSYHMSIEKQFYAEPVDPLNKKIQKYNKKWQYSTEIKNKFSPKISQVKKNEFKKKIQDQKQRQKKRRRIHETDRSKIDGKNNLNYLHKHIQSLRLQGKIKEEQQNETILDDYTPHTPRPIYKDYIREEGHEKRVRHSIDLGSLKDPEYANFQVKNRQRIALRRQRHLQNAKRIHPITFLQEKKKLQEDFLEAAKAKMAILNKFQ